MAAKSCHILQLPLELLQHISDFLEECDLVALRLSCRALERATFDAFTTHYFRQIKCFFLDLARTARFLGVCSTRQLARKIRKVYLSLDPYGFAHSRAVPMSFVRNRRDDGQDPFLEGSIRPDSPEWQYQRTFKYHELRYHMKSTRPWAQIMQALTLLDPKSMQLYVDLTFGDSDAPEIAHGILPAIQEARYPIHAIRIFPKPTRNPEFSPTSTSDILEHLRRSHYFLPADQRMIEYNRQRQDESMGSVKARATALAAMPKLESFTISTTGIGDIDAPRRHLLNTMLETSFFPGFREIRLTRVELSSFGTLMRFLQRYSLQLRVVVLERISFELKDRHWFDVFRLLLNMPKLRQLRLRKLDTGLGRGLIGYRHMILRTAGTSRAGLR